MIKVQALAKAGETDKLIDFANKLTDGAYKDNAQALNNVAWTIVEKPGDKPNQKLMQVGLKAAKRADELVSSKDGAIADTLAKAYFETGDVAKALENQERAVKLAVGTPLENDQEMKQRLEQYRKAAKK